MSSHGGSRGAPSSGHDAFRALVGVELRRAAVLARNFVVWSVVIIAVLGLFGRARWRGAVFVPAFFATSVVFSVSLNTLRDKMDGSLDFLRTLPVSAATVVGARLCAGLIVLLVSSPLITGALVLWADASGPLPDRATLAWGLFLSVVCGGAAFTSLALGALLRLKQQHFALLVLAVFGAFAAGDELVTRWVPDAGSRVQALLRSPDLPTVVAVMVLLLTAGAVVLGFAVGVSGLKRYRPERDRITW